MKIKRYVAASMRAALDKVRAEQGPDAVILSSRRVDEGIEVIAAVDYDEALFVDATRRRAPSMSLEAPAPAAAAKPAHAAAPACAAAPAQQAARPPRMEAPTQAGPPIQAPAPPPAATPARKSDLAAARAAPVPALKDAAVGGFAIMQRELKDLRKLLESELSSMSWNDKRLREPLQARVLEELSAVDIAPDVAMQLAAIAPQCADMENPANIPLALLVRHLPVVNKLSTVNGGVIAVVGPTGAGKTTTIAKLASRLVHAPRQRGSGAGEHGLRIASALAIS